MKQSLLSNKSERKKDPRQDPRAFENFTEFKDYKMPVLTRYLGYTITAVDFDENGCPSFLLQRPDDVRGFALYFSSDPQGDHPAWIEEYSN